MFIPFLPIILATLALSFLVLDPSRSKGLFELSLLQFVVLLFLGSLLLAQLGPWLEALFRKKQLSGLFSSSPSKTSLSRMLLWLLWYGLIFTGVPDHQLQEAFAGSTYVDYGSVMFLLISYWFADAMVASPFRSPGLDGLKEKMNVAIQHSRIQLPILLLGTLQSLWLFLLRHLSWTLPETGFVWIELVSSLLILLVTGPPILVHSWGAKPITNNDHLALIREELLHNKVPVRSIYLWPETIMPQATAGVIGLVPRFRYLVISIRLIDHLNKAELQSVVAHEACHLRERHLFFFVAAMVCFFELIHLIFNVFTLSTSLSGFEQDPFLGIPIVLVVLLLFLRYGVGFLSRNFERQADCHALTRNGLVPMANALYKAAWINDINPQSKNWHHWGIQERIEFLKNCTVKPVMIGQHHRRVKWIQSGSLVLLSILIALNIYLYSDAFQIQWLSWKLDQNQSEWSLQNQSKMNRLADLLYFDKQFALSEKWYRKALKLGPKNTHTLNNLSWLLSQERWKDTNLLQESVSLAERALRQHEAAFIWDTAAEAYRKSGDLKSALQAAHKALELAEQGIGVMQDNGLGYYREQLEKIETALTR